MYQLKFKLNQHTPIIHFQPDQKGATLRVTELKPKLDRFIIEKCALTEEITENGKTKIIPKVEFKKWFINDGKQHLSLDYCVRIESTSADTKLITRGMKFPCFFGDMGDEYARNEKGLVFSENPFNAFVFSYNKLLLDQIAKELIPFFEITNFGTRQSKGFGSYYIQPESPYLKEYSIDYREPNLRFSFEIAFKADIKNWFSNSHYLFNIINLFYKSLRQGINEKGRATYIDISTPTDTVFKIERQNRFYLKPLIFLYAKSLSKQWDKKTIKDHYLNTVTILRKAELREKNEKTNGIKDVSKSTFLKIQENALIGQKNKLANPDILTFSEPVRSDSLFADYKDLFGLSSEEAWKSYDQKLTKSNSRWDNIANRHLPLGDAEKISRFKSPIIFKPIKTKKGYKIYFDYFKINANYKGQKFNIELGGNKGLTLQIPNNFDFKDFFDFVTNKTNFDLEANVNPNEKSFEKIESDHNYTFNYFKELKNIFDSIQKQKL